VVVHPEVSGSVVPDDILVEHVEAQP